MDKEILLKVPPVRWLNNKLWGHYSSRERRNSEMLRHNLFACASRDAIWVYTLMKSGTTYTLLFLANYLSYVYGDKKLVSFDRMNTEFFWHSFESAMYREDFNALCTAGIFARNLVPEYKGLIHTHVDTGASGWRKAICLYRNPLDYMISSYYFHYVNRGVRLAHPREIIDQKIGEFVSVYGPQSELFAQRPADVLRVSYEDLMNDPGSSFKRMVEFLGLEVVEEGISFAMENSSKKKVKEMESARGEAVVQGIGSKFAGSFVRSGKVGEWKDYFSEPDLEKVEMLLSNAGYSLNDFTLE